jgi:NADP-dependent 3-hydroxy acid dehydrogenase YdfG
VRRIFITGASSGIGAAMARHYAAQDTKIGLFARRREPLEKLAASLPGRTAIYAGDIADTAALEAAAKDFLARFGAPDLVVANAGISIGTRADAITDAEKLRRVLDVNVTGMAATLSAFAPSMRAAGRGTLCGIASVAGFRGLPGAGAYSASKAAALPQAQSATHSPRP